VCRRLILSPQGFGELLRGFQSDSIAVWRN
jgi:hypothetical protein